jgi:ADP-heptose:LPS heptosyltransferase
MIALPGLRALRASRPDAEITLVGRGAFLPLLQEWGVADRFHALPPKGFAYLAHFHRLRRDFPDVWILLTNSLRGDLEAWLSRVPQRFGIVRPHRRRPLLTHAYRVPESFDESRHHQLELWEAFLKSFGLARPLDRTPISRCGQERAADAAGAGKIGLIPGSENEPGKRWPASHWLRLIGALKDQDFTLFGTEGDQPAAEAIAAAAIAAGTPRSRIQNLAGRTTLQEFARSLGTCRLVVANDSGGMHLANALGVPVIGLFGPTNPLRTGPVFSAPFRILQPLHCPPAGGGALSDLAPETVAEAVRGFA